jgi:hypothetical protein
LLLVLAAAILMSSLEVDAWGGMGAWILIRCRQATGHRVKLAILKDKTVAMAYVTLALAATASQLGLARADDRSPSYLNDMRIMACVTAENAVRARLKEQGPVSFESCASNKFDVDLAADDRDYTVEGYATVLSAGNAPASKRFLVRLNHNPRSYGAWGFDVIKIVIDP